MSAELPSINLTRVSQSLSEIELLIAWRRITCQTERKGRDALTVKCICQRSFRGLLAKQSSQSLFMHLVHAVFTAKKQGDKYTKATHKYRVSIVGENGINGFREFR